MKNYPEINKELVYIDNYISKSIKSRNKLLTDISLDILKAGGKRLRPLFTIIFGMMGEYNRDKIVPLAAAIEVLHTATLVHDDIIDNANIRRGKKTVSYTFGADMAVYVGDYLFTRAVMMLSKDLSTDKLHFVAKGIKSICEGEVDQYCSRFDHSVSVFSYLKRIKRKTASLFVASCAVAAHESGMNKKQIVCATKFGLNYGLAFQIRDDINDFLKTTNESGKPVLKDVQEGVFTLPVIYALEMNKNNNVDNNCNAKLNAILSKKHGMKADDIEKAVEIVKNSDGIKKSEILLLKIINKAEKDLSFFGNNKYKNAAIELLNALRND